MERNFTVGFGSRRDFCAEERERERLRYGLVNAKYRCPFAPREVNDITCNGECAIIPFCVARLSNAAAMKTIEDD